MIKATLIRLTTMVLCALVLATPAQAQTETIEYYGLDAIGSVRVIVDQNGQPIDRMDYGPFGENLKAAIKLAFDQYAQLARDGETGQDYAEARNYSPSTGRFNRVDPVYAGLFEPQIWNRYAYALNNPLGFVDPSGMQAATYRHCVSFETKTDSGYHNEVGCFTLYYGSLSDSGLGSSSSGRSSSVGRLEQGNDELPAGRSGLGSAGSVAGSPWVAAAGTVGVLTADDATGIGVVDDIAIPVVLAAATVYDVTQRTFVTYTLQNPVTGQTYVGRTSGFGTPQSIVAERYSSHHMRAAGFVDPRVDRAVQGLQAYPAIRGREQQLIDSLGGVGSAGVGNAIRGVSAYNPLGSIYHNQSNVYFGNIAPFTGRW